MKKRLVLAAVTLIIGLAVIMTGCQTAPKGEAPVSFNLKIIETSDVHGAIFPYDFINDMTNRQKLHLPRFPPMLTNSGPTPIRM